MESFPEVITHNYDPRRGPCRNVCELSEEQAERVLDEIRASGLRAIKPNYLERRRLTEEWLIRERRRLLGPTKLERPVYFFLGDFADGKDPSRPSRLVMRLREFPPETLTFTYPDSMASLPIATRDDLRPQRKRYHGQVFTLGEIEAVVAEFGMPGERWKTDPTMKYDKFIEVQVWDDRLINERLLQVGSPLSP
ncbi:hypothetical protein NKI46_09045 [Mesorhizobium sp. M0615]|uniref:hypothetical protein n=1 Tax=unclassified Mesorhizobium TaxID=325217 RepID=UPI0003CF788A|nr:MULTISPECIES: hypothetical protein [unclassified Mesorhizobium]ESY10540.1 hypothetical protein X752_15345 [Mesorhizobium sp. LNJC398B00]